MTKITDPYTLCTLNAGLNSGSDDRAVHVHEMLLMNMAGTMKTVMNIALLVLFMTAKKKFWRNFMLRRLVRSGVRELVREVVRVVALFVFLIQSLNLEQAPLARELGFLEEVTWKKFMLVR